MADISASVTASPYSSSQIITLSSYAGSPVPIYAHNHRISGTVKVNGVVAQKMVALFNREKMEMLSMKLSNADGTFEFKGLPEARLPIFPNGLLVLAIDSSEGFNAEIADKIEPVGIGEAI